MEVAALKVNGGALLQPERSLLPRRIDFVPASTGPTVVDLGNDDGSNREGPKPPYFLYTRDKLHKLLHRRPDVRAVGRGLENAGNTCFFNSVLQVLTYTTPLQTYLTSKEHSQMCQAKATGSFCALCLFEQHVAGALQGGSAPLLPKAMLVRLKELGGRKMQLGRQEDAHEFLRQFLDACHKSLLSSAPQGVSLPPVVQHTTLIHQLFGGYLRSQVTCLECNFESNTFDPFLDLSLEVNANATLEKALEFFTKSQKLAGLSKYRCKRCKQTVDATKKFSIHNLPPVVTFQLKRFEINKDVRGKIMKQVSFPTSIDLARFTTCPEEPAGYRLYAVIVHSGHSAKSGHYFAFARHGGGTWCKFDDEEVKPVSEQLVLRQQAYLLFYEAIQTNGASSPAPAEAAGVTAAATNGASSPVPAEAAGATAAAEGPVQLSTPPRFAKVVDVDMSNGSHTEAKEGISSSAPAKSNGSAPAKSNGGVVISAEARSSDSASEKPLSVTSGSDATSERGAGWRMPKVLSKSLRSLRRLRRRLQFSNLFGLRRRVSTAVPAPPPLPDRKRAHATNGKNNPLPPKRLRRENGSSSRAVDVAEVLTETRSAKPPVAPEPEPCEFVEQDVDERVKLAASYDTQFGLAKVDRWDDDDMPEIKHEDFKQAQMKLQPAPEQRDQLDAEYDVGKRKHKPKKPKVVFTGKTAFDLEAQRRHKAATHKGKSGGRPKGKGKGKDKGKGKGKSKGKGKGMGKFKG